MHFMFGDVINALPANNGQVGGNVMDVGREQFLVRGLGLLKSTEDIGAIVLNRARIGRHCVVGAGALVTEGKEFPDYAMILGSPAKVVKTLTPEEAERFQHGAAHYVDNARRHRDGLRRIDR